MLTEPVKRPRMIPSLDGLRAVSIVLVIALHSLQHYGLTHKVPVIWFILCNGSVGVYIFFVISGYLITTLLLREHRAKGRISLRDFYIRRGFRILPPLYVYVLTIAVLGWTGRLAGVNATEIVTALFFLRNYSQHVTLWVFEHFWSLCVEEQFYLLWPGLVVFALLRRGEGQGRRLAARVAVAIIVAEPFIRLFCWRFVPTLHNTGQFHMSADCLMFGAAGALLEGSTRFEALYRRATRWPWLLPVVLFGVLGALGMRFQNYFNVPLGDTLQGFVILMWLLWLVRNPATAQGRFLNGSAIRWVGRLSYSLYIWQTFFIHYKNVPVFGGAYFVNTPPGAWLSILVVATFSYYVIEQPSLRLRDIMMRHMRKA
jgi:peptidoglycan/LPS O-acetylase OafA/YrhL